MKNKKLMIIIVSIICLVDCADQRFPNLVEIVKKIESFSKESNESTKYSNEQQRKLNPDVEMSTLQMIKKEGYPAEAHAVLTKDGYLLTVHRIRGASGSPAIFLQHGLLDSSYAWVIGGRKKGLVAFILSDLGYDVFMGNSRGNTYSRSHVEYETSDVRFWDFSWHEMGIYDLPASLALIKELKGDNDNDKITYVGHSMGTTMFYVMAIEKPEHAINIDAMFSLAPIAFMNHLKSPIRFFAPFVHEVELIFHYLGRGEFLPQNVILKFLARYGCDIYVTEEKICANALFVISGFDESEFNFTLMPEILSHTPAGASTKTLIHYAQEIKSGRFQRYDYGRDINLLKYNSTTPPDYDLSKINVPVALFWAQNDWLASPVDVQRLYDGLPNKVLNYKVNYPKFNHLDFLWAVDAFELVYKKLLAVLKTYRSLRE